MRIEVVDGHSINVDELRGGVILDAGARGFRFSQWFAHRGNKVLAFDPAPDIQNPRIPNVAFYRMGLVGSGPPGAWHFVECSDKEASYIKRGEADRFVPTADVRSIMAFASVDQFDVVKLNVEGAEYEILETWPGPISRQVVVSFHEHTGRGRGRAGCDRLIERMSLWYDIVVHRWEARYCAGENYWDTLLTLKERVKDLTANTASGSITNNSAQILPAPDGSFGGEFTRIPFPSAANPNPIRVPHFTEIP